MCVAMRSTKRVCDCDPGKFEFRSRRLPKFGLPAVSFSSLLLLSGLFAPMSIDHGSKVTPIKAGPMAELAAMREQYANSGGVPPPPGAPTLPGEGHHCSARVLLSCGASQARAWLS
jgi:hypothetical protein